MISQKERAAMIEEAAMAICQNAGGDWNKESDAYLDDARAALKVFEPVLLAEVQNEYNRLHEEMDRLVNETEYLESKVAELEALV